MLKDRVRVAKDYLKFRMEAYSRFSIHSPFLFELVNDVFRDKREFYAFNDIEKIRQSLLSNKQVIHENHAGAQSKTLSDSRSVRDIAQVTTVPRKYGELLFRLANHLHPGTVLELGTGLGMSSLYLGAAVSSAPFITLEGSTALAKIAREQFVKMQLNKIQVIEGDFNDTLTEALNRLGKVKFVFIDGDHRKNSIFKYIEQILPYLDNDATVVVDDIYWSEEMKMAWEEIVKLPRVTLSINLFRMGILFFRDGIKVKQDLKVVIY